jgi:hypothetical protein
MRDRVPLVAGLGGHQAEAFAALLDPPVARVAEVVAEHAQREVVTPDSRGGQALFTRHQGDGEVLDVVGTPDARIGIGVPDETAQQGEPRCHGCVRQKS